MPRPSHTCRPPRRERVAVRSPVSQLVVETPTSMRDALARLQRGATSGAPLAPLAGGTDILVDLEGGRETRTRFLNVWPLRPTRLVSRSSDGITISAFATFSEIAGHTLTKAYPMLRAAAREVGSWQIQNRGTLGGNIANGSPAGDSLPVLLALDAEIELASRSGTRRVPFATFYTGYRATVRRPEELLVAVHLPAAPRDGVQFFRKVGTRQAQAISKVVLAGVLTGGGETVREARLAIGSVGPTPLRLSGVESVLTGARLDDATIARALEALDAAIAPIDDIRSDAAYRRVVAGNTLRQFLEVARSA